MRRTVAPAWLFVILAGCAMPVDGASGEDEVSPLRFELEYGEDNLVSGVRLVNDGVEELKFASSRRGYAPMPRLFVEARQENGDYVGRGEWYPARELSSRGELALPPGGAMSFPAGYSARDLRPGDYRVSLSLFDPRDSAREVSRELGRTGWPVETVETALAIRRDAVEASCASLVRAMTYEMLADADADGIELMEDGLAERWARDQLHDEMLARGAFASELADYVRDAPMDELGDLMDSLGSSGARVQAPVQRAASERLLELVENPAVEVLPHQLRVLQGMVGNWPEDAPPILIERLESGHDEGYALDELLRVFVSAQSKFRSVRPRLFAIVQRRCEGVRGEDHEEACQLAKSAFDPTNCGSVGIGGFGTSCRCGGLSVVGGSRCDPIHERWESLLASAPAAEDYALPTRVEAVVPRDDADDVE